MPFWDVTETKTSDFQVILQLFPAKWKEISSNTGLLKLQSWYRNEGLILLIYKFKWSQKNQQSSKYHPNFFHNAIPYLYKHPLRNCHLKYQSLLGVHNQEVKEPIYLSLSPSDPIFFPIQDKFYKYGISVNHFTLFLLGAFSPNFYFSVRAVSK